MELMASNLQWESGSPLRGGVAGDQIHGFHQSERENSEESLREGEPPR